MNWLNQIQSNLVKTTQITNSKLYYNSIIRNFIIETGYTTQLHNPISLFWHHTSLQSPSFQGIPPSQKQI